MPTSFTWSILAPAAPAVPASDVHAAADSGAKVFRDLKVDFLNRRLVVEEGALVFVTGAEAILQDVWLALGLFEGEWFLDLTVGFPYFRLVLVKNPNLDLIRAAYRDKILSRAGVKGLTSLDLTFNRANRALSVAFRLSTDVGELASSGAFTLGTS